MRGALLVFSGLAIAGVSYFAVAQRGAAPSRREVARRDPRIVSTSPNIDDNALVLNGTPIQNLALGALTSTALVNEIGPSIIEDPFTQKFMKYMIECALPGTSTITVGTGTAAVDFHGSLGLAPEWETGKCEVACQEWVSACLYARSNVYGVTVRLYFDGPAAAFEGDEDYGPYDVEEGAFYGNFFLDQPLEYSCRGSGNDPLYLSFRVCARPGHICGIQNVGPCGEIDGETGLPSKRHACTERDARRNFSVCRNRPTIEGTNDYPEPSTEYRRVITTRVRHTTFQDGLIAGDCVNGTPDAGVAEDGGGEPDAGSSGSSAGKRCLSDDDCNSALLVCDTRFPNYSCTGTCNNSSRVDYEEADCDGPGSTCLDLGGARFCTQACTTGLHLGDPGACEAGRACYTGWLHRSTPDRAGCYTFCSKDEDCNGATCDPRVGACGAVTDNTLAPDGTPCDATSTENICRGICFQLVANNPTGVCGSFVNLAAGDQCPDDPDAIKPFSAGGDDLAVCAFRSCANANDCPDPLLCLAGANGRICTLN